MKTDSSLKIFIGGIHREVSENEFSEFFKSFGSIKQCILMRDGMGLSRGFGFVICDDLATYDTIFDSELMLKGKRLEQKKAVPQGMVEKSKANVKVEQCKLFVGGLAPHIKEPDLKEFFSRFGDIKDIVVLKDSLSGKSRGFGFVTFILESSVEEVLKNPRYELGGRTIQCKRAQPAHMLNRGYRGRGTGREMILSGATPYPLPVYSVRYESPPRPPHPLAPLMTGYGQPAFQVGGAPPVYVPEYGGNVIDYSGGYGSTQRYETQQGIQQPQSQPPLLQAASYIPAIQSYKSTDDVQSYSSQDRYQPY